MTECSRCGDCCDPITLGAEAHKRLLGWGQPNLPHPFVDPTYWTDAGWEFWRAVDAYPRNREDGVFIAANWTVLGKYTTAAGGAGLLLECDYFDTEVRMCRAGPGRPPVCRDYPWYGREPGLERGKALPTRCSFNADLPQAVELTGTLADRVSAADGVTRRPRSSR